MPELPEVETVCRGLAPIFEGRRFKQVLQRRPDLRFPLPRDFAARLQDRRIETVRRRAKYILIDLDGGETLLCHLGMSGRMVISGDDKLPLAPHDHIVFVTEEGRQVRFNDARRFGFMDLLETARLEQSRHLKTLGPEPLGNAFSGPVLAAALKGRRTSIKAALLDQRVVAGIGNIYACEALYVAGLSPRRLAQTVQGGRAERLAAAVKEVLTRAIAAGGSSLRDYVQASGELGYFQHEWRVYAKEGELSPASREAGRADLPVRRIVQGGRSTFYCPLHQR
ncbi:MAG: bifunctional DNA-formamidopyrimidine glycosylase/DNA-(apurinic or apyrimidinic site) lyase [Rhodovibrionaceae bacterium]